MMQETQIIVQYAKDYSKRNKQAGEIEIFANTSKNRLFVAELEKEGYLKANEEIKQEIKPQYPEITIEDKREIVKFVNGNKEDRANATEMMVQRFLKNNHVYTLRSDLKEEIWIYHEGIYIPEGKTFIKEFVRQYTEEFYTGQLKNAVIEKIIAETFISEAEFFDLEEKELIPIQNGLLNIFTRELLPFTPKKRFFAKINAEYYPESDCPLIKQHFKTCLNKDEDIDLMQEVIGYCLYKTQKFKKAFLLDGNGENGKSKTLEIIEAFIGRPNSSNLSPHQFTEDGWDVAELFGKLINVGGDIKGNALEETGMFKKATGGDMIKGKRKFLTPIYFKSYAKNLFACNEVPNSPDDTDAFYNRWIYIKFENKFVDKEEYDKAEDKTYLRIKDKNIIEKLETKSEFNGLLIWALDGLKRLLDNNKFSDNKAPEEIKKIWARRSSSCTAFAMDQIQEDWDSHIPHDKFTRHYTLYCRQNKLTIETKKVVEKILMKEFGAIYARPQIDSERVEVWKGIKFKEDWKNLN